MIQAYFKKELGGTYTFLLSNDDAPFNKSSFVVIKVYSNNRVVLGAKRVITLERDYHPITEKQFNFVLNEYIKLEPNIYDLINEHFNNLIMNNL